MHNYCKILGCWSQALSRLWSCPIDWKCDRRMCSPMDYIYTNSFKKERSISKWCGVIIHYLKKLCPKLSQMIGANDVTISTYKNLFNMPGSSRWASSTKINSVLAYKTYVAENKHFRKWRVIYSLPKLYFSKFLLIEDNES